MDAVRAWIGNGAANAENFFVDDDKEYPVMEGCVTIGVGGIFEFYLTLAAPHEISMYSKPMSKALMSFLAKCANKKYDSPGAALSQATQSYLEIADALDEENADEDEYAEEEEDVLDVAAREGAATAEAEKRRKRMELEAEFEKIKTQFDVASLPKAAVERILSDYNAVRVGKHHGWSAKPHGRDLSLWDIELFDFDKGSQLSNDMNQVSKRTGKRAVEMTMQFPKEYPFKPPFIRVVRPRFVMHTGRVTIGGSICTQVLTDEGWKPVFDIEALIETIREQITAEDSKAKIDHSNTSDYTEAEAREAFHRVADHHRRTGW